MASISDDWTLWPGPWGCEKHKSVSRASQVRDGGSSRVVVALLISDSLRLQTASSCVWLLLCLAEEALSPGIPWERRNLISLPVSVPSLLYDLGQLVSLLGWNLSCGDEVTVRL